ncbi:MAG: hypothetical protein IMX03_00190 [Brockia lithotrophica]|nr:hypothetical protein [Brockia lithotrophica]
MTRNATTIHFTDELVKEVDERGPRNLVVDRDLSRLYMLYKRVLANLKLTLDDARFIYEAIRGMSFEVPRIHTSALLAASLKGAILERGLDKTFGIDGNAFVERVRRWDEIASLAVIDAVERLSYGKAFEGLSEDEALREAFQVRG